MKPLRFTPLAPLERPLDVSLLTPERLDGLSVEGIRRLMLPQGRLATRLDRLYDVRGEDSHDIRFTEGSAFLQRVGQDMAAGRVTVAGDCGHFAGQGMRGGRLSIAGSVACWAGHRMQGGHVQILGNAGDYLAASRPGERHGMRGGLISVAGRAGARVGDKMRRGNVVILGDAGRYCASRLHAGTIIVLGEVGELPASGMRRGSLILGRRPGHVPVSFQSCGAVQLQFLPLLFRWLATMGDEFSALRRYGSDAVRLLGDLACGGKGEILVLDAARGGRAGG